MRIAYFDCPTGLSGNMILAALIDAGLPFPRLKRELGKLKIKGYSLKLSKISRKGFRATHIDVRVGKEKARTIDDIYAIIGKSRLKKSVKLLSRRIFERLFKAESKVHGRGRLHLHETGGTDAIIDIAGAAIGLDALGISEVYCSPLPFGYGPIKSSHGSLPNPAPATAELLKGAPVYKKKIKGELVTPTGAAIITTIAKSFEDMPKFELKKTGLGAGDSDFPEANILRLFIGKSASELSEDLIVSIEANIDDMNPEFYGHVISVLMKAGALDAYVTFAGMKKGRPGVLLTVSTGLKNKDRVIDRLFSETTTLGVRTYLVKRNILDRHSRVVRTKYGSVHVKVGRAGGAVKNVAPEYEDCARLARKKGVPLKLIYDEAKASALGA